MRNMDEMVAQFARATAELRSKGGAGADRLSDLTGFGSNPGALRARFYVPAGLSDAAPLVVVLHGCTQTAAAYDHGSGWSTLADRHGFALLFPEQQRGNNPSCCFNWFAPEDNRRDAGEAESIRQMVETMIGSHDLDRGRVFVTGLSAGGAMASVMLATYPELFAGGAIVAGLPYGTANSVPEAFERMRGAGGPGARELGGAVRRASPHAGPWPTISIWHGSGDATVSPANATAILDQWRALHGVGAEPDRADTVDGYPHRVWRDASGRDVIEDYSITGMGHGTPLATRGEDGFGAAGAFMLEASISSTLRIAQFWGLTGGLAASDLAEAKAKMLVPALAAATSEWTAEPPRATRAAPGGVQDVIEKALRAAGLMP